MGELLVDQLRTMARLYPGEVAYRHLDAGEAITFAQWEAASNRLARGLAARGIVPGDRVAIALPSERLFPWMIAYSAIHKAGAVVVPVNVRLTPPELATILGHAGIRAAVTCPELLGALAGIAGHLDALELVVLVGDDGEGGSGDDGAGTLAGRTEGWDDVLADDAGEFQVPIEEGDLADIMYTSGTTGLPKGVAVRHRNVSLLPNMDVPWADRWWMHGSPLFTFAGIGFIYTPMKMGMGGLFQARFDAGRWLGYVAEHRPVACFIVPSMAQLVVNDPAFDDADLSSIELLSVGSSPLAPETLQRLQARLPNAAVSNSYGMTEAGPAYCAMPKEESTRRIGSVGMPLPPTEVRIVDPDTGDERGPRAEGEVLLRLPGRQREYYRDPEATARTWSPDGWLHTGDIGFLDEDGYLYIVGRMKDVIIRGGNNIHATDVEHVLHEHPGILEAAVVGVPHEVLGEDIAAFVVAKAGVVLDPDEVAAFCRDRLADYKCPRRVTVIDELPRNATGKVLKRELVPPT